MASPGHVSPLGSIAAGSGCTAPALPVAPNSLPRPAVAGGEGAPAELVAEGAVEGVAGETDHGEGGLAAADGDAVAGLEGDLNLAVDHQDRRGPLASRDHLEGLVGAVDQRALGQRVGA